MREMEPSEIVGSPVAVAELTRAATPVTVALVDHLAGAIRTLFGPAAEEAGLLIAQPFQQMRINRLIAGFERAAVKARSAGLQLQPPDPKHFCPISEGMSLEGNEDMREMWASLLINASNPAIASTVRPTFARTLSAMAPDEAAVLKWLAEQPGDKPSILATEILEQCTDDPGVVLDALEASQLVRRGDTVRRSIVSAVQVVATRSVLSERLSRPPVEPSSSSRFEKRLNRSYVVTDLGYAFLRACGHESPLPGTEVS